MSWWRKSVKDGTFVEGVKEEPEHVHYDPRGGSDVPVHVRNQDTGGGLDLRNAPVAAYSDWSKQESDRAESERQQREEDDRRAREQSQNNGW